MFEKIFKKENVTLQKYQPFFITTDNKAHVGNEYNWAIVERLRCDVSEYLTDITIHDGYLKDTNNLYYPLSSILSIDWQLLEEKVVPDIFDDFQVFVTTKDLEPIER